MPQKDPEARRVYSREFAQRRREARIKAGLTALGKPRKRERSRPPKAGRSDAELDSMAAESLAIWDRGAR
jgi:hypothetical protein